MFEKITNEPYYIIRIKKKYVPAGVVIDADFIMEDDGLELGTIKSRDSYNERTILENLFPNTSKNELAA
jgi:hypothetical protein